MIVPGETTQELFILAFYLLIFAMMVILSQRDLQDDGDDGDDDDDDGDDGHHNVLFIFSNLSDKTRTQPTWAIGIFRS